MAEIHVEKKRGAGGKMWVLLLIVALVAAAVWAWQSGYLNLGALVMESQHYAQLEVGGNHGT